MVAAILVKTVILVGVVVEVAEAVEGLMLVAI